MTIAVRTATLSDIDRVAPLFDAYRGFYGQTSDLPRARLAATAAVAQRGDDVVGRMR